MTRARSRAEFDRFVAAHADGLLRNAYLTVGDRGEAEDLVQECLLQLTRKWPRVRSMKHPGAYARRVLFTLILDGGRRRSRRAVELDTVRTPPADRAAGPTAVALDARADLIRALAKLPARQRAVLVLRYFADLRETEVAATLGCSVGTVKSSASRGLESLRQTLEAGTSQPAVEITPEQERRTVE